MRLYRIFAIAGMAVLSGCGIQEKNKNIVSEAEKPLLQSGIWRVSMEIGEQILPFNIEIKKEDGSYSADIINGRERLTTLPFKIKSDSLFFRLPVFNSEFQARIENPDKLSGLWFNFYRSPDYSIPFIAEAGESERFINYSEEAPVDFNGKWEVTFSAGTKDEYKAIGLFEQNKNLVQGTFLTETGDYRFLEGIASGNHLKLSCFDGSHAFLFLAEMSKGSLNGNFFSGTHWKEPWVAVRNENFELTHPDSITYLKSGYEKISFSYPNLEGKKISFPSEHYENKVTIIQIMGSWCPNCMDETVYLRDVYEQFHAQGLEIIALCFERSGNPEEAKKNVLNHKSHLGAEWEFLLAGQSGKDIASKALPMLSQIVSFPTTIFIDKKGEIRKIHTGFYGPGTGNYYIRFKELNQTFIEKLLTE